MDNLQPLGHTLRRPCSAAATEPSLVLHRRGAAVEPPVGRPSVWRHTCMRTKKVPCTTAAAGAPWTSFVSAVDEVLARTPPAYRIYPGTIRILPGYGFPGQIPSLVFRARSKQRSHSANPHESQREACGAVYVGRSRWQPSVHSSRARVVTNVATTTLRARGDDGNKQGVRCVGWLRYVAL